MKYPLVFLCFCCLVFASTINAQDKEELFNNLEQIPAFKSLHKAFDLKQGEDLIVTVTPMQGVLGKLIIDIPESAFQLTNKRITGLSKEIIKVNKAGTYTFHFVNTGITTKELDIKIYKRKRMVEESTVVLDDIIFTSFRDTIKKYVDDTIPVPDVSEYSFILGPARNYSSVSDSCIYEELLKDEGTEYQYAAYWVGIGQEAIDAYDKLKNAPPPSWLIEGINEPLMAYGLGVTDVLPHSPSALSRDVMFKFMDPTKYNNSTRRPRLTRRDKRGAFYGRIPISSASKYKELLLSIRNFNSTTGVPVYIKFVKFRLKRTYRNEYIIRERVQEIFREKTKKVAASAENQ